MTLHETLCESVLDERIRRWNSDTSPRKFPGVVAMRDMHIGIRPGEIHGLIGENGAGKSTLIKVLTGVHIPEEGEILVDGRKVSFANPVQAREHGIACVYQELGIVPMLPVVDNVFMGRKVKNRLGLLDTIPECTGRPTRRSKMLGHPEIDTRKGSAESSASAFSRWWRSRRRSR